MSDIVTIVTGLSDEHALEAINLLSGTALGATPDAQVLSDIANATGQDEHTVRTTLEKATAEQIANLARVVLIAYASNSPDDVRSAIDNSGRKALFIEILTCATVALGIAYLAVTKGKSKESSITTTEIDPDGTARIRTETTTTYFSVGQALAPLVKSIIGDLGTGPSGGSAS
jgi:hypothetical protein